MSATFVPRSLPTILNELLTEKASFNNLLSLQPNTSSYQQLMQDLTSTSSVSIWELQEYLTSFEIATLEQIMYNFQNSIYNKIDNSFVGSASWYCNKVLSFQLGDTLIIKPDFSIGYATNNPSAQIIASSASESQNNTLIIKVRRINTNILSEEESAQFGSFLNAITFAGSRVTFRNSPPDLLNLYMNILYTGQENLSDVKNGVSSTINNYINNLPFNSIFYVNQLVEQLLALPYIIDAEVDFSQSTVAISGQSFVPLNYSYLAYSGYLNLNTPLSTTITYTSI